MKIFFISPIGKETPNLFSSFKDIFEREGHIICKNIEDADTAFIDLFSGLGNYFTLQIDTVLQKRMNVVFFDESDYGGCKDGTEEWFGFKEPIDYSNLPQWQDIYWKVLGYCKVVYFMRKMDKTKQFPKYVHPYELTMYSDHIFPETTREELFDRSIDVCFIGNESPTRINTINGLKEAGINIYYHFTANGKYEHENWLHHHRQAKMFLSCDGGGYNDERAYQLIYLSVLLKVNNNQLVLHDFRDGLECIRISEHPTTGEIKILKDVLNDKELLYEIYLNCISRMRKYFNPQYRTQYILDTLIKEGIC